MPDNKAQESQPEPRKRACPKCGESFTYVTIAGHKSYPFCSERCRLIDLGAWLNEDYKVVEDVGNDLEQLELLLESGEISEEDLLS